MGGPWAATEMGHGWGAAVPAEVEQAGGARRRRVAGATVPDAVEQGWVAAAPAEAEHGGGGGPRVRVTASLPLYSPSTSDG